MHQVSWTSFCVATSCTPNSTACKPLVLFLTFSLYTFPQFLWPRCPALPAHHLSRDSLPVRGGARDPPRGVLPQVCAPHPPSCPVCVGRRAGDDWGGDKTTRSRPLHHMVCARVYITRNKKLLSMLSVYIVHVCASCMSASVHCAYKNIENCYSVQYNAHHSHSFLPFPLHSTCMPNGSVQCFAESCSVPCPFGEKPVWQDGQCCPTCQKTKSPWQTLLNHQSVWTCMRYSG